jgi:membrane protein
MVSSPSLLKRSSSSAVTAAKEFAASEPMGHAAAIAYYTIFSLPAVLIITVMAAATLFDEADVRAALMSQAGRLIGPGTASSLQEMLDNARITETRFMAKVLGVVALVISAGSVFASLQSTLNHVWQVEAKPGRAILKYLTTRLLSLALVASFGFLMLVSLAIDAALVAFGERLMTWLSGITTIMITALNIGVSFGIITVIFAMIFKVLPDARIKWSDVWGGAVLTALLFSLGKYLIGLYIGITGVGDTYGAAGAVVIILVWVYYSAVILIYGAHFTHVHTREHGSGVHPSAHAVTEPATQEAPADLGGGPGRSINA